VRVARANCGRPTGPRSTYDICGAEYCRSRSWVQVLPTSLGENKREIYLMPKVKLPKCGKIQRHGGITHGFGVGPTKRSAKQAAYSIAQTFASMIANQKLPDFVCPEDCPRVSAQGIVNKRFRERISQQVAPGVFICFVSLTFDFVIICE
jgi:acyl-CoA hydrolase